MRRMVLLLTVMAAALVLASGVALAVNKLGTDGPDTLTGTNGDDTLLGKGGDDVLIALKGRDDLLGGPGKDVVFGGNEERPLGGDKNLGGGSGNDAVLGSQGSDNAMGGSGNDFMPDGNLRESSEDRFAGGSGNDVIVVAHRPAFKDVVVCGEGLDRVLADRKDVVAGDCDRVYFGLSDEEFSEKVPQSFWEGLP
jgi:RTX calcium-binding nonapeptide repeat (4 copies)